MFYDRFVELCKEKGMSPAAVAREIGLSNSSTTTWKRGSIPKGETLQKLADYFGVSVDFLMGKETEKPIGLLISSNIKLYREKLGVSQKSLAEHIGVPVERVQDLEDGKSLPTIRELEKISSGLWTTPEDILSIQHLFNESFIREKFLEIVFSKFEYTCFRASFEGKNVYVVAYKEKAYEITEAQFNNFIESIDDYIDFSMSQLLKKAAPQDALCSTEGVDTPPPPEGPEGPQEGE